MRLDVVLLGLALAGVLAWMFRRDQLRARAWRAQLLTAAAPLLSGCRQTLDRLGFPVLQGRFQGHAAEVALIIDTVGVRRLPSLWVSVTLKTPLPGAATLDILARPANTEFYSPAESLPHRLNPPADWPQHIQIKADRADAKLSQLAVGALAFFSDPRAKQLLVTPRGVRLLYLAEQGRRGEHLLLRTARFDLSQVDGASVADLLERALGLHRALAAPGDLQHAA